MKKVIFSVLLFISILLLLLRFSSYVENYLPFFQTKAGVRVESNVLGKVTIDGKNIGQTPAQDEDLKEGTHLIELASDTGSWKGYVTIEGGTLAVINRELAPTAASSSGEIITLNKGAGATVISTPSGADVTIDGKSVGKTPLTVSALTPGEHLFILNHSNYLERSIRAAVTKGYSLTLTVDLAISEADLTQVPSIVISPTPQLIVKQTPTGFLNVRDAASLNGNVVEKVSSGDTMTLEDEQESWDKVKLSDGKEGFVSTQYVQKKTQ